MNSVPGVGGGHVPGPLQQRVVRDLPPAAGPDPLQLGGQVHQGLGHRQEDVPPHIQVL